MNSCAPVQPLSDPAAVAQAVGNVAERSFFVFAEAADPVTAAELVPTGARALSASVRFAGPCTGEMHVTMPDTLTRELATLFSGDPELVFSDADLVDMAGEFGNMVTGAWLTAADATSMFDLAAPVVIWVDAPPLVSLMMQINGQPVGLSWSVE